MSFGPATIKVGDRVNHSCWTDASPCTVVAVRRNGKEIDVQMDKHSADQSKTLGIGHQDWILERNEQGPISTYSWRTRQGKEVGYHTKGYPVSSWRSHINPGWRYYYDWSF